ncbi:MAG: threonylcarbamoyl-AMP synthase [Candidatus Hydrogenedentes bacterium]|nr:threonylcarbamoyl-AMP synthase [Candidatus Hydrogenedentota bacterium]
MRIVPSTPEGIAEAAEAIASGQLVVHPTETVYGIAADPFSDAALARLFACKGRQESNPILLVAADLEQVREVTSQISEAALRYAEAFWPGPLSLLLPKSPRLPKAVTAGQPYVCVRVPAHPLVRDLCRKAGHAITSSSANLSGEEPATCVEEVEVPGIAICIDGGTLAPSLPSTVFDPERGVLLREGAVSRAALGRFGKV